jgi:orotidine-5'-phosphate decarboxylase
MAQDSGCDGVVASPHEVAAIRKACGDGFLLVVPGVRPAGADLGDQKRVMTPREAVAAGADYLVIGRPITGASDPLAACAAINAELDSA